jgi:hypothetical protein
MRHLSFIIGGKNNMGSGDKFELRILKGFGLAFYFNRFPHEWSFNILIGCVDIYLGFGKGYDEPGYRK